MKKISLLTSLLALFSCEHSPEQRKTSEALLLQFVIAYEYCEEKDGGVVLRYFLNCSDLHKQKDNRSTYLYDEIMQKDSETHSKERAYYIGYYKNRQLIRYKKVYRGQVLMDKEIH